MTSKTITPKKCGGKQKIGEIFRLKKLMNTLNLQATDLKGETGVSVRTIEYCIYDNNPIGNKLLRGLHEKYGVSVDWLLSGTGAMMTAQRHSVEENAEVYVVENPRTARIVDFVTDWMTYADPDEQAWLETELKFKLADYKRYLETRNND